MACTLCRFPFLPLLYLLSRHHFTPLCTTVLVTFTLKNSNKHSLSPRTHSVPVRRVCVPSPKPLPLALNLMVQATCLGDRIIVDLDIVNRRSWNGKYVAAVFVDEFTRSIWTRYLVSKGEVIDALFIFIPWFLVQFGLIRRLRTDNEKLFHSTRLAA